MNPQPKSATDSESTPAINMPKHPWLALTALIVGVAMIVIDGSVVNVLLPDMVNDIGLTQTDAEWVNSIYSLIFAALLITVGLLADNHGRRLLFLIGMVVFVLGSVASGMSGDPTTLISARAVQAVGASMMLPSSIAVINVLFTGKNRAVAFGLWGAVFGGAAALGPLLGGWLAQDFSWRWAFLINVPVAIISFILVLKFLPESKAEEKRGFDLGGVLMSSVGLGLIVFGLIEGQDYGWWSSIANFDLGPIHLDMGGLSVAPVSIFVGVLLLVALVWWTSSRSKQGKTTLLDLRLFKIRRYGFGNVVALVVSLGEFGILFVLPLWLQSVGGFDALTTGALIAFLAVGTLTAGGAARHVSELMGPTNLVRTGMALEVVGILGLGMLISVDRSPWWLVAPLIVYGLGVGFATAQLTNVVLADVPPKDSGQASAMTSTFRQVGSALGAAILGAILFSGLGVALQDEFNADPQIGASMTKEQQNEIIDSIQSSAGQAIVGMESNPQLQTVVTDAKQAYTDSAKWTAFAAGIFVLFGLATSFALPKDVRDSKLERVDKD